MGVHAMPGGRRAAGVARRQRVRELAWWQGRAELVQQAVREAIASLQASLEGHCGDCQAAQPGARCLDHQAAEALLGRLAVLEAELERALDGGGADV